MTIFITISIFIFGTIIGSFLNVVILRYNTGISINGRSGCFSCAKKLEWYELIPLVSFFVLHGKCSVCRSKISWQYPLVELSTAVLFVLLFISHPTFENISDVLWLAYNMLVFSLLVVMTVYDMRHKIIPDGFVYSFIALGALVSLINQNWQNLLAGAVLFIFFFLLWYISKGTWMGFGDAKLALGIGFFMGLVEGVSSIVFGFWIGAVVSLSIIGISRIFGRKGYTMKSEIPFAPYLIIGMLVTFFFHIDVLGLRLFFGV